jgi:hypothetical protein
MGLFSEVVSVVVGMMILWWIIKSLAVVLILGVAAVGVLMLAKTCN